MAKRSGGKRRAEEGLPPGQAQHLSSSVISKGEVGGGDGSTTIAETSEQVIFGLEFDGASKGNPGKSGAGALLKHPDGSVICELTKGVGVATCNFAEYQALIIGLRAALEQGIYHIEVRGDSKLVCKQVMGLWKLRSENLEASFAEVVELKKRFQYFSMKHVYREFNSAADKLANAATLLPQDEVVVRFATPFASSCKMKIEERAKIKPGNLLNEESLSTFLSIDAKVCCQLAYHGASKGNPGKAGAGVVVSCPDGSMHLHIKQGLGISTRNYAHYHALVIGLQAALDHNISHIRVQGDSVLVYKQMIQQMKVKDENLLAIWKEATALLSRFTEHSFSHVDKSTNSEARILAGSALHLPEGNVMTENLCDGSSTCGSSTVKVGTVQKMFLNTMKISMESNKGSTGIKLPYKSAGIKLVWPTQFLGAYIPCHSIHHPRFIQQANRVVVPRPCSSLFSVSMSKCLPLNYPNSSMNGSMHLGNCTKWRNLPHFISGIMFRIIGAAPIAISTVNLLR